MIPRRIACTECGTEWVAIPGRDDPNGFVCDFCLNDDPNGPGPKEWDSLYGHNETLADELP